MLTRNLYLIKFRDRDGLLVGEALVFTDENERDAVYDAIDGDDPRVPETATQIERHILTLPAHEARRRNPLTGHFTGGDRGGR